LYRLNKDQHQIAGTVGETENKETATAARDNYKGIRNDRVIIEETLTEAYYRQHDFNVCLSERGTYTPLSSNRDTPLEGG
jgi:hypothetical protein